MFLCAADRTPGKGVDQLATRGQKHQRRLYHQAPGVHAMDWDGVHARGEDSTRQEELSRKVESNGSVANPQAFGCGGSVLRDVACFSLLAEKSKGFVEKHSQPAGIETGCALEYRIIRTRGRASSSFLVCFLSCFQVFPFTILSVCSSPAPFFGGTHAKRYTLLQHLSPHRHPRAGQDKLVPAGKRDRRGTPELGHSL